MPSKNNVTSTKNSYDVEWANPRFYFTKDGLRGLRTYLGNVEKGQPKVYTAPFAKGQDIQHVLEDWNTVLESIRDKWPTLYEFENDLRQKVGPLSVQKPLSERISDVEHYFEDILLSSAPIDDAAITAVLDEFSSLRGLRLRSIAKTVDLMKKSTNSGNPFFTKRRNVVQDTVPCQTLASTIHPNVDLYLSQDSRSYDHWFGTAVVGWRGQEGGPQEEDVKQRVVWMFPFSVNVNELQVYQPFIEGAQALNLVPAWVSMRRVDEKVTALFDSKAKDDLIVCTDFSRFDQHFNSCMQDCAGTILYNLLANNDVSHEWMSDVWPVKYQIPLVMGADNNRIKLFDGYHGMASGSGGTNVDETLAHRALQHEAAIIQGQKLNPNSMCLGDDGILTYPGITVEDVVKAYQSHGQECNPDKQYAATHDCIFLRRWHHTDYREEGVCVGVYSTMRAIGRLRYLERFMDPEYWSPELVALRQLSIIENCNHHPLREEFAQFCMKRDKYRLGLDLPGFLDNINRISKEAIDHMPDFLGYTKTLQGANQGIQNWWIVQYLKSCT